MIYLLYLPLGLIGLLYAWFVIGATVAIIHASFKYPAAKCASLWFNSFWRFNLKFIGTVLGLIIVPLTLPFARKAEESHSYRATRARIGRKLYEGWTYAELPAPFNYLWGNPRYGVNGSYVRRGETFWQRFLHLAIHNPVAGLMYTDWFRIETYGIKLDHEGSDLIHDVSGKVGSQLVWEKESGKAGYYAIFPYSKTRCVRIRIGYKLEPTKGNQLALFSYLVNPFAKLGG